MVFWLAVFSVFAATQPHGSDRLRELVVFPQMTLSFNFGMSFLVDENAVNKSTDVSYEISQLREEVKRQPNDVRQLLRLGDLLDQNGETNESVVCYQKAEQLCRTKVANRPQNGLALTDLGAALGSLQKKDEAESVYRKAVLVSSNEWRCWTRLGNFLAGESTDLLFPTNSPAKIGPQSPPEEISEQLDHHRPSAEAIKKSDVLCSQASQCFDKAIALAPKESDLFFQRAGYMSTSNLKNNIVQHLRNGEPLNPMACFFSEQTIADLEKAAELNPKNYDYISLAAYFTLFSRIASVGSTNFTLDLLPDKSRQLIRTAITRLENLSENPDKKIAAAASENLGMLHFFMKNPAQAETCLRRAVALDPNREQCWDLLLAMLLGSASPDELLAVAQARLKAEDSARNHILLSKILAQKMSKWKEAFDQAKIARHQETNNIVPPLMLAAIALKQTDETNYLLIASTNLICAGPIIKEMAKSDEKIKRSREFLLDLAILYALDGEPEDARHLLENWLKRRPNDSAAKEILEAVQ